MKDNFNKIIVVLIISLTLIIAVLAFVSNQTPPHIKKIEVRGGQANADVVRQEVQIGFDRPMQRITDKSTFQVTPDVPYILNWNNNVLKIVFQNNLTYGTNYEVKLAEGKQVLDRYDQSVGNIDYKFTTKPYTWVYLSEVEGEKDKVIKMGIDNKSEVLIEEDNIERFAVNESYIAVQTRISDQKKTLIIRNLKNPDDEEILGFPDTQFSYLTMNPHRNMIAYVMQKFITQDDGLYTPQSGSELFLYDIELNQTRKIEYGEVAFDVSEVVFTPDGNNLFFKGTDGTFYIMNVSDFSKVVPLGKFFASGGFNSDADKVLFMSVDPSKFYTSYPFVVLYSSDRMTSKITSDEIETVDPEFWNNRDAIVIARGYAEVDDSRSFFEIGEYDLKGENYKQLIKMDGFSLELPKPSSDDKYLIIEKYKKEDLSDFENQRIFGYQIKPMKSEIILYNVVENKIVKQIPSGRDGVWVD